VNNHHHHHRGLFKALDDFTVPLVLVPSVLSLKTIQFGIFICFVIYNFLFIALQYKGKGEAIPVGHGDP
jgi:hypothetical protein